MNQSLGSADTEPPRTAHIAFKALLATLVKLDALDRDHYFKASILAI
jgi:hypothetical protein